MCGFEPRLGHRAAAYGYDPAPVRQAAQFDPGGRLHGVSDNGSRPDLDSGSRGSSPRTPAAQPGGLSPVPAWGRIQARTSPTAVLGNPGVRPTWRLE